MIVQGMINAEYFGLSYSNSSAKSNQQSTGNPWLDFLYANPQYQSNCQYFQNPQQPIQTVTMNQPQPDFTFTVTMNRPSSDDDDDSEEEEYYDEYDAEFAFDEAVQRQEYQRLYQTTPINNANPPTGYQYNQPYQSQQYPQYQQPTMGYYQNPQPNYQMYNQPQQQPMMGYAQQFQYNQPPYQYTPNNIYPMNMYGQPQPYNNAWGFGAAPAQPPVKQPVPDQSAAHQYKEEEVSQTVSSQEQQTPPQPQPIQQPVVKQPVAPQPQIPTPTPQPAQQPFIPMEPQIPQFEYKNYISPKGSIPPVEITRDGDTLNINQGPPPSGSGPTTMGMMGMVENPTTNTTAPGYNFNPVVQQPPNAYPQLACGGHNPFSPYSKFRQQMQQPVETNPLKTFIQINNRESNMPYGGMYINPYQNPYMGVNPYAQMQARQNAMDEQVKVQKMKAQMICKVKGIEYDDEYYDKMFNPNNPANRPSEKEIQQQKEWDWMVRASAQFHSGIFVDCPEYARARNIQQYMRNYHTMFDNHSMFEFLNNDLWKLELEDWMKENLDLGGDRDLSGMYNSEEYNRLIEMHCQQNPEIKQLFDILRYDERTKHMSAGDIASGLGGLYDRTQRIKNILNGKLPQFISDDEAQKRRRLFTETVLQQAASRNKSKEGGGAT